VALIPDAATAFDAGKRLLQNRGASQRPMRGRLTLVVLAVLTLSPGTGALADWTVRPEPAAAGRTGRCVMQSERQSLPDGYQTTWAQIVVDDQSVRVVSASELDAGDGDLGLAVDEGTLIRADEVSGKKTAVFTGHYATLVDEFKRGLKARVQLRFWPTWPKTTTHSATFSLIGFTRAHAQLADCRP
jgi:hypothetical protein